MVVKIWVISGVYLWNGGEVRLDEVTRLADKLVLVLFDNATCRKLLCTDPSAISGPTHVPCPICAVMQQVKTDGVQIDLGEHLMRHSGDLDGAWGLKSAVTTTSEGQGPSVRFGVRHPTDPGDGHRLLKKSEALKPGDELLSGTGAWKESDYEKVSKPQEPTLDCRRRLNYPDYTKSPADGFRFLGEMGEPADVLENFDEIWSFVTESWKPAAHRHCKEFEGLPVVARRKIPEGIEKKQDVKPEAARTKQNCVFFVFAGESFAITETPDGKFSLHRRVPYAGMSMIVERVNFELLVKDKRHHLCEVLLKSGIRLRDTSKIMSFNNEDFFSSEFIEAAEKAWGGR